MGKDIDFIVAAVLALLALGTLTYASTGKAWYEGQGMELRLECYSTATGIKCANMWVKVKR